MKLWERMNLFTHASEVVGEYEFILGKTWSCIIKLKGKYRVAKQKKKKNVTNNLQSFY